MSPLALGNKIPLFSRGADSVKAAHSLLLVLALWFVVFDCRNCYNCFISAVLLLLALCRDGIECTSVWLLH